MDRHGIDQVVREQMLHLNAFKQITPNQRRVTTGSLTWLLYKRQGMWFGTNFRVRGGASYNVTFNHPITLVRDQDRVLGDRYRTVEGAMAAAEEDYEGGGAKLGTALDAYVAAKARKTAKKKPAPKKPAKKKPAPKKRKVAADKPLKGKTFLFTGKLASGLTRDEAAKLVRKAGGTVVTHVAKDLDYLVAGAEGSLKYKKGGGKFTKVKKLQSEGSKVRVLSEKAFLKFFGL